MSQTAQDTRPLPVVSDRHVDPHAYPDGIAFLDGQYLPMSQVNVSVLDWGSCIPMPLTTRCMSGTAASSGLTCISTASSADWRNCA